MKAFISFFVRLTCGFLVRAIAGAAALAIALRCVRSTMPYSLAHPIGSARRISSHFSSVKSDGFVALSGAISLAHLSMTEVHP